MNKLDKNVSLLPVRPVREAKRDPSDLIQIQADLGRLELELNKVTDFVRRDQFVPPDRLSTMSRQDLVSYEIQSRANRLVHLPARLFADPAWDMLLELYLASITQVRVSISHVCTASKVPSTTALRWIAALETEDLVSRKDDPLDGRRSFIGLTPVGLSAMDRFFNAEVGLQDMPTGP